MKNLKKGKNKYLTKGAKETQKLGGAFAKDILKRQTNSKEAVILALSGDLGGGKTTFLQGFAKGLGVKEKVLSPTFVIQKKFKVKKKKFENFYHIDCYRINSSRDILELGVKEILKNNRNIVALEWPERMKSILRGRRTINIKFEFVDKEIRRINF